MRLYPIICSIRVSKTEIKRQISESFQIVDDIAFFCSNMQNNQVLFCRSHFVDIQKPKKNRLSENYCTDASRFVCQRTEKWFQIRKRAKVAGSTSNAAVGLKKNKRKTHTFRQKRTRRRNES